MVAALCGALILAAFAAAQPPEPLPKLTEEEVNLLAPYLTKDFFLTGPLEVRDELTGFGTFYGTIWNIQPNGAWTITRIIENFGYVIGAIAIIATVYYFMGRKARKTFTK